ncbi:MAG: CBS domain-containing protein [Sphingobacteriia bacterium]|nr:CBS domain-containing protein [Sphingobacteriia bacterium]NCC39706.1 CBS domain-containing protein [Gammaproteobacteria bacterium]
MIQHPTETGFERAAHPDETAEIELSDADILEAMREIPGYLDITTGDFRALYHLAYRHALDRLFQGLTARRLMRDGIIALRPEMRLADAIALFTGQGLKALPVVAPDSRLVGILTVTDVLRAFGVSDVLELIEQQLTASRVLGAAPCDQAVARLMTTPVVSVPPDAGFRPILAAFNRHPGRAMPVATVTGELLGLLLRKDFMTACHLEGPG